MAQEVMQGDEGDSLSAALERLDHALAMLEERFVARSSTAPEDDLFESDRVRLSAELDAARARERALEEVASEASAALGRAAAEVRAALSAEES